MNPRTLRNGLVAALFNGAGAFAAQDAVSTAAPEGHKVAIFCGRMLLVC